MENPSPNHSNKPNNQNNNKRPKNGILLALIITVAIILVISWLFNTISNSQYNATTYSDFLQAMESGQLAEVEFQPDRILYMTKEEAAKPASAQTACFTGLPSGGDVMQLAKQLHDMGVTVNDVIVEDNSMIVMVLYYVIMFVAIFAMMRFLTKRMSGDGIMGGFGKSRAKVYMEKQTGVTFQDVAGQDEAKESYRRSSISCIIRRSTRRSAQNYPRVRCWWVLPVPVRPCLPRPLPVKPMCLSSPSPVLTLWKCS